MSIPLLKKKERFPYAYTTYNKINSNSLILSNTQCIETSPSCLRRTGFTALWTSVLDGAWGPREGWHLLSHHPFCGSGRNHAEKAPAERSLGWLQTPAPGVLAWDFLSPRKRTSGTSPPGVRWSMVIPWDCSRFVLLTPTWLSGWFPFHCFPCSCVFHCRSFLNQGTGFPQGLPLFPWPQIYSTVSESRFFRAPKRPWLLHLLEILAESLLSQTRFE